MEHERPTLRVKFRCSRALAGGGHSAVGEVRSIPAEDARRLVLQGDAELIPPTEAEREDWDRKMGLLD